MKIVLIKEVAALGKAGAVVEVANGYARNYLIPRGLGAEATKGALAAIEERQRSRVRRDAEALAEAEELAKLLESKPLSVPAKSGGNGKLFGTVTNANVAEAIAVEFQVDVDRHKIDIPDNIKSLGTYPIEIKLAKNVIAKTTVKVVAATA